MSKFCVLAAALGLATLSTPAMAQGGFVRVEGGRAHATVDVDDVGSAGEKDTTWAVRGGYYFNDYVAVEAFYTTLFDSEIYDDAVIGEVNGKLTAVGVGVAGKRNFGDNGLGFFVSGRTGLARGRAELSAMGDSASDSSTKPYFGVGMGYDYSRNFGLSVNYDRYRGSKDDVTVKARTLTLGVEYRF